MRIVTLTSEQCMRGAREILVELEACCHPLRLHGDGDYPLAGQVCRVRDRGRNMLRLE
jgi:hypothetical protein